MTIWRSVNKLKLPETGSFRNVLSTLFAFA